MSAVAGETVVFLEATAVYVLAVAEVYGIPAEHRERRRALVLAVLVGEDSKHAVADLIGPGRTSGAWLSDGAATLPLPAVSQLNSRLLRTSSSATPSSAARSRSASCCQSASAPSSAVSETG